MYIRRLEERLEKVADEKWSESVLGDEEETVLDAPGQFLPATYLYILAQLDMPTPSRHLCRENNVDIVCTDVRLYRCRTLNLISSSQFSTLLSMK